MDKNSIKIQWTDVMWTNHGVFLNAQKTKAAVRKVIHTYPGECVRFDLSVYKNGQTEFPKTYLGLHFQCRGVNDAQYFDAVLSKEHRDDPKSKFRVTAYKAMGI